MALQRWRAFTRSENGGTAFLITAVLAALVWANTSLNTYEATWSARLSVTVGPFSLGLTLREWINSGFMALFFFLVGLDARRELDKGELRDRKWMVLCAIGGVGSMAVPALVFVAFNAGLMSVHGWGVAMSTDTAFALAILSLVGDRLPSSLRAFMLSISVMDDVVALVVLAVFYGEGFRVVPFLIASLAAGVITCMRLAKFRSGVVCCTVSLVMWCALLKAGVDPVVTGLTVGLLVITAPAGRDDLERATGLVRDFREQPTAEMQQTAVRGLVAAISQNDHLQRKFTPWVNCAVLPLFAVANSGVALSFRTVSAAFASPIAWGIICGYLVGKIVGVVGSLSLVTALSGGRLRPNVGWGAATVGGAVSGAAFTVSLLIASKAFTGNDLAYARIAILSTLVGAMVSGWVTTVVLKFMSPRRRARALLGRARPLTDLVAPVDAIRDRIRGPVDAEITVVEYGDFECPHCGRAESALREMLTDLDDVRYVWRHLPLPDVHPHAQLAAEAAEAAGDQGRFWEMHDLLLRHQDQLTAADLVRYATQLGLDVDAFRGHMKARRGLRRIEEDVSSADLSGAVGTPTFFVNGRRYYGSFDSAGLSAAVQLARQRVLAGKASSTV
ncbi:sodium:proton antiporter [Streptomyces antibioticus]|nr:Na+/H+ antiporter NhaA [Streptomyces antibioticus]KOG73992.1 sodium:proton antiporter [Streptomyces antibioticus]